MMLCIARRFGMGMYFHLFFSGIESKYIWTALCNAMVK
jgi:hypothetical protein